MSNVKLQPVLDRIDADFDNSLERLFALLRSSRSRRTRPHSILQGNRLRHRDFR
jgi:hypothetical protein